MRPVRRGPSPQDGEFDPYRKAHVHLVARLGRYCSYCERPILLQLAVEHIQPKGLPAYHHLEGTWTNFLLGCVNCNSTKLDRDVVLAQTMLPDRDNTFVAFEYMQDGTIRVAKALSKPRQRAAARACLALVGLDKPLASTLDENGQLVALDRVAQRMEAWSHAEEARGLLEAQPDNVALAKTALKLALATGYFSVWMTVFSGHQAVHRAFRLALIQAFPGTAASGCFDHQGKPVSPASNPDRLPEGGKC